jgi:Fe-S-cluster containining protein
MPRKKIDRCTGHCCRHFTLAMSPDELWEAYRRWLYGGADALFMKPQPQSEYLKAPISYGRVFRDIHLVAPMVRYLGYMEPPIKLVNPENAGKAHYYTCKHLAENGDCTIYEHRPDMCRAYPNGHECEFAECTWKSMKAKKRKKQKGIPKDQDLRLKKLEERLGEVVEHVGHAREVGSGGPKGVRSRSRRRKDVESG